MVTTLGQSPAGGSWSFLALAGDGRRYWCKTVNNGQHPRVPVNEQIIGRLGRLIGAATCEVALVKVPDELAGWEFHPGRLLEGGWAHGSLAIDGVVETHALDNRASDDNSRRHAGFYAIYDWAGGDDPQWLVCGAQEDACYSHDHGHYFPGGPAWSIDSLRQNVSVHHTLQHPSVGLDGTELRRLAEVVENADEERIAAITSKIPAAWPIGDEELEALVDYLIARRSDVATRLRAMATA